MAQDKIAGVVEWALYHLERRATSYRIMQDYAIQLMDKLAGAATLQYAALNDDSPLALTLEEEAQILIRAPDGHHAGFRVWFDDYVHDAVQFADMSIDDVAAGIIELLAKIPKPDSSESDCSE